MFICVMVDIVFFFFKQKTAYEMRISDWSSDVCSSDLLTGFDRQRYAGQDVRAVARQGKVGGSQAHQNRRPRASSHRKNGPPTRLENGRASCRERVCQYV